MAKVGRKRLSPEMKRTHTISVRLSDDEAAALDEQRGNQQRGAYMRQVFFNTAPPVVPELNLQAWQELSRTASNLNQLARKLNQTGDINVPELIQILADLRAQMIGAKL